MPNSRFSLFILVGCVLGVCVAVPVNARASTQVSTQVSTQASRDAFMVETIADGLNHPWGMAFLPDGTLLVTERSGRVRQIRDGVLLSEPVANTPAPFHQGQGGYFDILPHPDFAQNQLIYLSFSHGTSKSNTTRIIRARLAENRFSDIVTIFDSTPRATNAHYGGRMVFLEDATLLLTTGDGFEYREKAQQKDNSLGKIVRLNDDGTFPADNPYPEGNRALWTFGHRSPQGLALDRQSGIVYMHEHGPQGGDEINIVEAGKNYGWPVATYGIDYSGAAISPFTDYPGTVQPIKYWVPSIAPSGLAVYRGDVFTEWDGDLLVGALAGKALHRVMIENGQVVGEEVLLKELNARIRDVRVGPDGLIYVTTDSPRGKILRLSP